MLRSVQTAQKEVALFGGATGAAATAVVASIAAAHGMVLGIAASSLVPVVGPIIAGITLGIQALVAQSGCGQTCIITSQWANQAEPLLQQNIAEYFALPAPRTLAQQTLTLANFDTVWKRLIELCSQADVGDAGKRCISDRQAGACVWKQTSNSPLLAFPGEPQPGQCWNWQSGYRDPIANDPVVADSAATEAAAMAAPILSALGLPVSQEAETLFFAAGALLIVGLFL